MSSFQDTYTYQDLILRCWHMYYVISGISNNASPSYRTVYSDVRSHSVWCHHFVSSHLLPPVSDFVVIKADVTSILWRWLFFWTTDLGFLKLYTNGSAMFLSLETDCSCVWCLGLTTYLVVCFSPLFIYLDSRSYARLAWRFFHRYWWCLCKYISYIFISG